MTPLMPKLYYLQAYEITCQEYKEGTHYASMPDCAKCKTWYDNYHYCKECPEFIFSSGLLGVPGCAVRKLSCVSSEFLSKRKQQALIEYHKEVIHLIQIAPKWDWEELTKIKAQLPYIDNRLAHLFRV